MPETGRDPKADSEPKTPFPPPEKPSDHEYNRLQESANELRRKAPKDGPSQTGAGLEKTNSLLRYTGLGMQFVLVMLLPMGGGYGLDVWLDTLPWFTLGGFALGATAAMWSLIRESNRMK